MNSIDLTQNSDPLDTILRPLIIINTALPRLKIQTSAHFNTKSVILNTSTQPTSAKNRNIELTPHQLVNFVRQFNSRNSQQATNVLTPFYLQAASTPTLLFVVRQNTQLIYLYLGCSVSMEQSLRPFNGNDLTYTTDFSNAITANMVLTAGKNQKR